MNAYVKWAFMVLRQVLIYVKLIVASLLKSGIIAQSVFLLDLGVQNGLAQKYDQNLALREKRRDFLW